MVHSVELEVAGRTLRLETGHMAKQADGSILATYGDTVVLATAVASRKAKTDVDFLPLTVNYEEKAYSAGKIPGGFFKREGAPSEKETLTSRLIDRPIRPLFPKGYFFETQVVVSVLSVDQTMTLPLDPRRWRFPTFHLTVHLRAYELAGLTGTL